MRGGTIHMDILIGIFEQLAALPFMPSGERAILDVTRTPFPFPWRDHASIGSAGLTCRWWRESILSTAACWSTITLKLESGQSYAENRLDETLQAMRLFLKRSRGRALKVIILNDESDDVSIFLENPDFTRLVATCVQRAEDIHVRTFAASLGRFVKESLTDVPQLKRLTLWHLGLGDPRDIWPFVHERHDHNAALPDLPSFPNGAPALQEYKARGWTEESAIPNSGAFPMLDVLCLDKVYLDVTTQDWRSLANTFSGVSHLFLFWNVHDESGELPKSPLYLPNLVHIEVEQGWDLLLSEITETPKLFQTPKLQTAGVVLIDCKDGNMVDASLIEALSSSQARAKKFIIDSFARTITDASYYHLTKLLWALSFIESLEFRHSRFRRSSSWIIVWVLGDIEDSDSDSSDDEDEVGVSSVTTNTPDNGLQDSHQLPQGDRLQAKNKRLLLEPLVPLLRELTFNKCDFVSKAGAVRFAAALARGQARREQLGGGIRRVSLIDMNDEATTEFVAYLRGQSSLAGVEIVYA